MNILKYVILALILILLPTKLSGQEFYSYIGKSVSNLTSQRGEADIKQDAGSMTIYKFYVNENENNTYSIKNGVVIMAIKGIAAASISEAKKNSSIQILYYMSLGFTKQGGEAGMTILKKGKRVLTIGWMDKYDGIYSTIVSAL